MFKIIISQREHNVKCFRRLSKDIMMPKNIFFRKTQNISKKSKKGIDKSKMVLYNRKAVAGVAESADAHV